MRCNTFEIGLIRESRGVIYMPERGGQTGPITGYAVFDRHILLKTAGQRPSNRFPGDTSVDEDYSVEYYFIVDKSNDALRGPFTISAFNNEPDVASLGEIDWIVPRHPNPKFAYLGLWCLIVAATFATALCLAAACCGWLIFRAIRNRVLARKKS